MINSLMFAFTWELAIIMLRFSVKKNHSIDRVQLDVYFSIIFFSFIMIFDQLLATQMEHWLENPNFQKDQSANLRSTFAE